MTAERPRQEASRLRELLHGPQDAEVIYQNLLSVIEGASAILFGEATHGTHEFYELRADLTKRLIQDKGVRAIAVEADWPDAYRVNRFVRGLGTDRTARRALGDFQHFPLWMWKNEVVESFIGWLRGYNEMQSPSGMTGFYGVDLYSMYSSIDAVLRYLRANDPEAARRAIQRYSCLEPYYQDAQAYGYAATLGLSPSCREQVLDQLLELQSRNFRRLTEDGFIAEDELFSAERNAATVSNAEAYYRALFDSDKDSWTLRDTHMADTIDALIQHLSRFGSSAPLVVWEHNSHIGDARAYRERSPEATVGQLLRERHGDSVRLIGFTTHGGTVTAASEWGGDAETKTVRAAVPGSYEDLFHLSGIPSFALSMRAGSQVKQLLATPRLHRAIGVIYRPETERWSHYFETSITEQYDAVIHLDTTRAVTPRPGKDLRTGDLPETFPAGV